MTWGELVERWKAEQYEKIAAAVARQDALLAEIDASPEERARFAEDLREALISSTDLRFFENPH